MAEIIINPNTTHKEKSPQTLAALSFFGLFLLSILIFFTKRALDPTLSLYRDLFYSPTPLPLSSSSTSYSSSSLIFTPPPAPADSHISSPESSPDSPPESADSGRGQEKNLSISQSESESFSAINETGHSETVRKWAMPCDVYVGNWVKDEREDYPLYSPGSCPYVDEAFDCQSNGRRDSDYLKWRWKPHGCELPRGKPEEEKTLAVEHRHGGERHLTGMEGGVSEAPTAIGFEYRVESVRELEFLEK